jgi:hypothetical protein
MKVRFNIGIDTVNVEPEIVMLYLGMPLETDEAVRLLQNADDGIVYIRFPVSYADRPIDAEGPAISLEREMPTLGCGDRVAIATLISRHSCGCQETKND